MNCSISSRNCFPRVCGDVPHCAADSSATSSFSPRMRGCSSLASTRVNTSPGFPRVCGDVPNVSFTGPLMVRFSPRMRGCSPISVAPCSSTVVFPAYAGMFRVHLLEGQPQPCFPRVCGDVPQLETYAYQVLPFSPRMRGCSDYIHHSSTGTGVFPAYAGMFPRMWSQG